MCFQPSPSSAQQSQSFSVGQVLVLQYTSVTWLSKYRESHRHIISRQCGWYYDRGAWLVEAQRRGALP